VTRQEIVCGLIRNIWFCPEAACIEREREVPYIAVMPEAVAAAATSIRQPLRDQLRQEVIGKMSSETEANTD